MPKARFKKGTNDADGNGKKGGSLPSLPLPVKQYMSDGNNPEAVKGGEFPVLLLDDGSRVVGSKGQDFDALIKQAQKRGLVGG